MADKREKVESQLKLIAPKTILFLRKLKGLTVTIGNEKIIEVIRDDGQKPVVEFASQTESSSFWVVEKKFDRPDDLKEEKREKVTTRNVSVAFPLTETTALDSDTSVFAFLPTKENVGFRFLLNADFILNASRESIQYDKHWNKWLRNDCIVPTFLQAFESLIEFGVAQKNEKRFSVYGFIPLKEEVTHPFFAPILEEIYQELEQKEVVLTRNYDEGPEELKLPEQARMNVGSFRELINAANGIPSFLNEISFVHPDIDNPEYHKRLKAIGVQPLLQNDVWACLSDETWLNKQNSSWFVKLYSYLFEQKSWITRDKLANLRLLCVEGLTNKITINSQNIYYYPIATSSKEITEAIVTATDTGNNSEVAKSAKENGENFSEEFYSMEELSTSLSSQPSKSSQILSANIGGLPIPVTFLDQTVCQELEKNPSMKGWFGQLFNIKDFTAFNCCLDYLAGLNNKTYEQLKSLKRELLNLTKYLCEKFVTYDSPSRQKIKGLLPLILSNGTILKANEWQSNNLGYLATPISLNSEIGWHFVFSDEIDRSHLIIVSDDYLEDCQKDSQKLSKWRSLFRVLGISEWPEFEKLIHTPPFIGLDKYEKVHLKPSFRSRFESDFPDHVNYPKGENFINFRIPCWLERLSASPSEEIKLVNEIGEDGLLIRIKALLAWLAAQPTNNQTKVPICFESVYTGSYFGSRRYLLPSEFKDCLDRANWFPSTKGRVKLREVFVDSTDVRETLGDNVAYISSDIQISNNLINQLGIRRGVSAEELLAYLETLSTIKKASEIDFQLILNIYTRLESIRNDKYEIIKQKFSTNYLIFVKDPNLTWCRTSTVLWEDLSQIFGNEFSYLERTYDIKLKNFFVEKLGVLERAEPWRFAQAYIDLVFSVSVPEDTEAKLELIYAVLLKVAKEVSRSQNSYFFNWSDFWKKANKIWVDDGSGFTDSSLTFIPDDGYLVRAFRDVNIKFVWKPRNGTWKQYRELYAAFNVRSLRDSVEVIARPQGAKKSRPELFLDNTSSLDSTTLTNDSADYSVLLPHRKRAICYYLWNELIEDYSRAKKYGILQKFLLTKEVEVESLEVYYKLNDIVVKSVVKTTSFWNIEENTIYLLAGYDLEQIEIDLPPIIAQKLISLSESTSDSQTKLKTFIATVLTASPQKVEMLIRKDNWSLPAEEETWIDELLFGSKFYAEEIGVLELEKEALATDSEDKLSSVIESQVLIVNEISINSNSLTTTVPAKTDTQDETVQGQTSKAGSQNSIEVENAPALTAQYHSTSSAVNTLNPISTEADLSRWPKTVTENTNSYLTYSDSAHKDLEENNQPSLLFKQNESQESNVVTVPPSKEEASKISVGSGLLNGRNTSYNPNSEAANKHYNAKPKSYLRSYVQPDWKEGEPISEKEIANWNDKDPETNALKEEERNKIEQAGITKVLEYEHSQGRLAKELPPNHKGWDIESFLEIEEDEEANLDSRQSNQVLQRLIEVKATEGEWELYGVGISPSQFKASQNYEDLFYLYVVEYALDPNKSKLYIFQNPAAKINNYRFDDEWKKVANEIW